MADKVKQELLLTDNELLDAIETVLKPGEYNAQATIEIARAIRNAQLAKAEPLIRQDERERILSRDRPRIICLCGSTRFTDDMLIKQWWFTKYGFIVLSWCALPASYFAGKDKTHIGDQEGVKEIVDEVHLRKIDLADEIFVINKNGYIGESTAMEIKYAESLGKPVKYLEALKGEGKG